MDLSASVIIPAYNEESAIQKSLDSLEDQDAEVVVVVGGTDNTRKVAENHLAADKVLDDEKESGPGPARNQGARESSGEILLFTDAETQVQPDWVENHVNQYQNENVVGVGGAVRPQTDSLKHRVLFKILSDYWYRVSWKIGFIQQSGVNCSYRREYFFEENGFNEEMPFMEDTELSLRMKKHGKIVYDENIWVETSARRQEGEGYSKLFIKYFKAYLNYFVLDRQIKDRYFTSEEDLDKEDVYSE
jgi:glycosyltransferase involved in cell wall biosynthesis